MFMWFGTQPRSLADCVLMMWLSHSCWIRVRCFFFRWPPPNTHLPIECVIRCLCQMLLSVLHPLALINAGRLSVSWPAIRASGWAASAHGWKLVSAASSSWEKERWHSWQEKTGMKMPEAQKRHQTRKLQLVLGFSFTSTENRCSNLQHCTH